MKRIIKFLLAFTVMLVGFTSINAMDSYENQIIQSDEQQIEDDFIELQDSNSKKLGIVDVTYYDKNSNKTLESITLKGNIGDPYSVEEKEFEGYLYLGPSTEEGLSGVTGTFTDQYQMVTLYYDSKTYSVVSVETSIRDYVDEKFVRPDSLDFKFLQ